MINYLGSKKDKYGRPRKRITLKPFAVPTRFLSSDIYESEDDFDDFSAEDFIREVRLRNLVLKIDLNTVRAPL